MNRDSSAEASEMSPSTTAENTINRSIFIARHCNLNDFVCFESLSLSGCIFVESFNTGVVIHNNVDLLSNNGVSQKCDELLNNSDLPCVVTLVENTMARSL